MAVWGESILSVHPTTPPHLCFTFLFLLHCKRTECMWTACVHVRAQSTPPQTFPFRHPSWGCGAIHICDVVNPWENKSSPEASLILEAGLDHFSRKFPGPSYLELGQEGEHSSESVPLDSYIPYSVERCIVMESPGKSLWPWSSRPKASASSRTVVPKWGWFCLLGNTLQYLDVCLIIMDYEKSDTGI